MMHIELLVPHLEPYRLMTIRSATQEVEAFSLFLTYIVTLPSPVLLQELVLLLCSPHHICGL